MSSIIPASLAFMLCERLLVEGDGVFSAIRIVDVYQIKPGDLVKMYVLAAIRLEEKDTGKHRVKLDVQKPSGATSSVVASDELDFLVPTIEGVDGALPGFNFAAEFTFKFTELGRHYLILSLNNEEIARCVFFTRKRAPSAQDTTQEAS